jgi:hypothetical protein
MEDPYRWLHESREAVITSLHPGESAGRDEQVRHAAEQLLATGFDLARSKRLAMLWKGKPSAIAPLRLAGRGYSSGRTMRESIAPLL